MYAITEGAVNPRLFLGRACSDNRILTEYQISVGTSPRTKARVLPNSHGGREVSEPAELQQFIDDAGAALLVTESARACSFYSS